MEKLEEIKNKIRLDYLASEIKVHIFIAALKNFKRDFLVRPFPAEFIDGTEKNFDKLNKVADKIPNFDKLLELESLDEDVVNLLCFVLNSKEFTLKTIPKSQFPEVLQKAPCILKVADPKYVIQVIYNEDQSNSEKKFKKISQQFPTKYGYHGTKLFNLQSILNFGLQQHLNKLSLFGDGLYLSQELSVSIPFSTSSLGWDKAKCGEYLSCVTLCEYCDDPTHVKMRKNENAKNSDIPEKYLLISNNDIVRIRYLLIYASNFQKKVQSERNQLIAWCKKNFLAISMVFYAILLGFIGLSNSRTGEYYKQIVINKIYQAFESIQNVFVKQ